MAVTIVQPTSHKLRDRPDLPMPRKRHVNQLVPPSKHLRNTKKPPTKSGGVKKQVKVLGRTPKANKKLTPSAQVFKVRTYEAEQKAKRLAAARYQNKGNEGQAPAAPPAARRFKRGGNALSYLI
jgi:hypothetical protein